MHTWTNTSEILPVFFFVSLKSFQKWCMMLRLTVMLVITEASAWPLNISHILLLSATHKILFILPGKDIAPPLSGICMPPQSHGLPQHTCIWKRSKKCKNPSLRILYNLGLSTRNTPWLSIPQMCSNHLIVRRFQHLLTFFLWIG